MSDLFYDIDVKGIAKKFKNIQKDVENELQEAGANLANMTHAKLLELATDDLKSLSEKYKENIEPVVEVDKGIWVITLKQEAMWIEEGRKSGFMEELLNNVKPGSTPPKMGKNGKYRVIPFVHNKNPTQQSTKAQALADQIRESLKQRGISWKKIERNEDGSPRLGKLHSFNLESARLKPIHKSEPLQGVAVYQSKGKDGNVRRDVMTFRVISEKHRSEGLWVHPGMEGKKLMDKAFDWAIDAWERQILPNILGKYSEK